MNENRLDLTRVERHPESDMIMIVAGNGARALLVSESERHAIAAAGPGTEEQ